VTTAEPQWPSPAWATAFYSPALLGTTFTFAAPAPEDVVALNRCRTLDGTRADVAARMQACLAGASDVPAALRALAGLVQARPDASAHTTTHGPAGAPAAGTPSS
jgi:hypothetical protein